MPIRMPKVAYDVVGLKGGLDDTTPTLSLKPGVVRDGTNFECSPTGGYTRIAGYERYDGLAKPSDAVATLIQVASFTNTPSVGQTLTGVTSGATGYILAVTATYMVLTQVSGTFNGTEAVAVGATAIGTQVVLSTAVTVREQAQYLNLAADRYRSLIGIVPGSGPVRGVVTLVVSGVDKKYAFRNNAGATGLDVYVASASGWTLVAYKHEVSFTAGNAAVPVEGEVLTQGGVTSTVRRVMASSGSLTWASSNTAGRFVIDVPAGGSFAAGAATLSGGATCTLSGANAAISMLVGGTFEFVEGNFTGSASTIKLYGCDGVNRAFEFDGTTLAPIPSGATTDAPKHIAVNKNHLVLAVRSSLIISGPGMPFRFTATDGGAEIAVGDTITNLLPQPGAETTGALAVFAIASMFVLYGTALASWNLVTHCFGMGGKHYTGQNLMQAYALDDIGVINLATSQAFGNFEQATLTANLSAFIKSKITISAASSIRRDKSQYRLFFSDGTGLYMTVVNGKLIGSMPGTFANTVFCAWEGMLATGAEVAFFGGADGYVYEMDVGTSFDGAAIDAYFTLNWNSLGSPRVLKRFRHASLEMQGNYFAEVSFGYQLGYGTTEISQPEAVTYASGFQSGSTWDLFTWDDFYWDGRTLFPTEIDVRGTAENIQVTIRSTSDYIAPFTVNSIINHYSVRRGLR